MPPPEEDIPTVVPEETPPVVVEAEPGEESPCEPLAKDLEALFLHMEARAAFRKLFSGQKASRVLPEILRKLSQSPPLPAGEASDGAMMLKNIHHFFRILSPSELRLLKELLSEDTETVEWNLQLGYAWFRAADRCPDLLEFKPSPQAAYAYAGFFVNTIGGKAYLVRRPSTVRVLVTYYSLLVLDQADKGGANVYGVDLLPPVQALREELRHYRGLRRHRVYMQNLREMETRLLKKRGKA